MLLPLSPMNDFLVDLYVEADRYIKITGSLLSRGLMDFDQAVCGVRTKLYTLHDHVYDLLGPLDRKLDRFDNQVLYSLSVTR